MNFFLNNENPKFPARDSLFELTEFEKVKKEVDSFELSNDEKKEKKVILLFGPTQKGKSTFGNFLLGSDFIKGEEDETISLKDPKSEYFKIGDDDTSQTMRPKMGKNISKNIVVWDLPGVYDTNGKSSQLSKALLIKKVVHNLEQVKLGTIVTKGDFEDASIGVEHALLNLSTWIGKNISFIKKGIFLLISKCSDSKKNDFGAKIKLDKKLQNLYKRNIENYAYQELVLYFLENMEKSVIFFPNGIYNQGERRENNIQLLENLDFVDSKLLDFSSYEEAYFRKKVFYDDIERFLGFINLEISNIFFKISNYAHIQADSFVTFQKKINEFSSLMEESPSKIINEFSLLFYNIDLTEEGKKLDEVIAKMQTLRKISEETPSPLILLRSRLNDFVKKLITPNVFHVYKLLETTLLISSYYGRTNDFYECYAQYRQNHTDKISSVIFKAEKTLFMDTNIILPGVNLFIYCNQLIVEDKKVIDLSGSDALDIVEITKKGQDGKPGLPGRNSGSLVVESKLITNQEGIIPILNGGKGGKGQNGGDALKVPNGLDPLEKIMFEADDPKYFISAEKIPTSKWRTYVSSNELFLFVYEARHEPNELPGKIGSGGKGGCPGHYICNSKDKEIQKESYGRLGENGLNGNLGDQGNPLTLFKKIVRNEKFFPIVRKIERDKRLIINQIIGYFDAAQQEIFESYIRNDQHPNHINRMDEVICDFIKKLETDPILKKHFVYKPTKEDCLTPYLFKAVHTENLIKYKLMKEFFKIVINKGWVTIDDLFYLVKVKEFDFSTHIIKLRGFISLMNVIVYLQYYKEYKQDFDVDVETQKVVGIQLKILEGFPEIPFDKPVNYQLSYFLEKMMDEFERKKSENVNIKDKNLKKFLKKRIGSDRKKKLSKQVKDFQDSNIFILKILKEAKFFSFIKDYDMGVMVSPLFILDHFKSLFTAVDLHNILEGQSFSFPRWSFDLKEFKNFLHFNLHLPEEPKKKDFKLIEERNNLIMNRLSSLISAVNHPEFFMANKDFYAGTATSLALGVVNIVAIITNFTIFGVQRAAVIAIEEAAIAAAGTAATGVAAGTGALVGGIVTASLFTAQFIGSLIGALANKTKIEKKYEINSKPRDDINLQGIQSPQQMTFDEFQSMNTRMKNYS